MSEVTVCIELDKDTGQFQVGIEPADEEQGGDGADGAKPGVEALMGAQAQPGQAPDAGGEEAAEKSYLKPVKSLEEALQVARDLLQGATGQQAQQAEKDFSAGFKGPSAMGA